MIRINCYAANKGWLFSDIQQLFAIAGCEISEYPNSDADAWIAIRSSELRKSPDITRTIVQVHNMEPHDIDLFNKCLGAVFCHPMQYWLWRREGFKNRHIVRPIGTRPSVVPPTIMPERPTIGFFCGENRERWKGSDVFKKVILRAREVIDFDCLLIGRGLSHIEHLGCFEQRAAVPDDYVRIDALFCASISPGVPLNVYEACAAGKPVISTDRWFPRGKFPSVMIGYSQSQLAKHIVTVIQNRQHYFDRRERLSSAPYRIDAWVERNIAFLEKHFERQCSRQVDHSVDDDSICS